MRTYPSEAVGQVDFYDRLRIKPALEHNTDGVWRGNLFEHKLKIDNIDKVLFQAIKYASRMRERGERLPANLVLNDLNQEKTYLFKSADFMDLIERVYFGAASKENDAFSTDIKPVVIDYADFDGESALRRAIDNDDFVRYTVDRNNILGLSQQFYAHHPDRGSKALKDAFLAGPNAEIRHPRILADRIHAYAGQDNTAFGDIMDALNPGALQRELGAFYTPPAYVKEMHKLLLKAIAELPEGMDYLVIDRCAGVGNLERGLPKHILKHCVLSTLEPNEYQLLRHHFADDCAVVVPNTDALAYDIIPAGRGDGSVDDFIRNKVDDPNCAIILMENPPFSEVAAGSMQSSGKKSNAWKDSWVCAEMAAATKGTGVSAKATNDLANLFIWSGFHYYLTKPVDSYILFAPTKYWRNTGLVNKQLGGGFLCNRKHFHASPSTIGCLWWRNVDDFTTEAITVQAYDIKAGQELVPATDEQTLRKARINLSVAYDKRKAKSDLLNGVVCERDGREFVNDGRQVRAEKRYSPDIVGYLQSSSFDVDAKNYCLVRCGRAGGNGFYLRKDTFLEKLPLFVAAAYPIDQWFKREVYSKSYDGNGSFLADKGFLKRCLFYTALTNKNKCRSFRGSDKRFYRNELCLVPRTLAQQALDDFVAAGYVLTAAESALLKHWANVLSEAVKTEEYAAVMDREPDTTLGLWQIQEEINVRIPSGKKKKDGSDVMVRKHAVLNTKIVAIDKALKSYYQDCLVADLFKHELLK